MKKKIKAAMKEKHQFRIHGQGCSKSQMSK